MLNDYYSRFERNDLIYEQSKVISQLQGKLQDRDEILDFVIHAKITEDMFSKAGVRRHQARQCMRKIVTGTCL